MKTIKEILREGVERGHWKVEDLDPKPRGYTPGAAPPQNLLRDSPPVVQKVQVIDDKDLPPMPHGITPAQADSQPLNLYAEETLVSGIQESSGGQTHPDNAPQLPVDGEADGSVFELW